LPIRVVHKCVIIINIYIIVAAPSAITAPSAAPSRAYRHTNTEGNGHAGGVIARRWVVDRRVRIYRRAVNNRGIITGNIDNVRFGLLYYDYLLALDYSSFNRHLLVGLQIPRALRLGAHPLYGVHHVGLLCQNGVTKVCRPLDVVRKPFDDIGKGRQCLNGRVPGLLHYCVLQGLVFKAWVLTQPLLELHDLQWISRGG
jgi:hypothetical protein